MRFLLTLIALPLVVGMAVSAPVPTGTGKPESPVAAARRALEESGDYQYQARSLNDVLAELKDRSRVNITLDPGIYNFGIDPNLPTVNVALKNARLRDALKQILAQYNLRAGLVKDGLYISHDDGLTACQLRQAVSVDCEGTPLDKAVAALVADTGANVVIDPRLKAKASASVHLKLEDVPLETALRLLAEVAELRAVRLSNVIFITSMERAGVLRQDADGPIPAAQPTPGLQQINIQNGAGAAGGIGIAVPLPAQVQVRAAAEKAEPEKK